MTDVETVALDEIDLFRAIRRSPSRSNIGIARHLLPILMAIIARERAAAISAATPDIEARLRDAATAVVARWDTPNWADVEPTAAAIERLRAALAAQTEEPTDD